MERRKGVCNDNKSNDIERNLYGYFDSTAEFDSVHISFEIEANDKPLLQRFKFQNVISFFGKWNERNEKTRLIANNRVSKWNKSDH